MRAADAVAECLVKAGIEYHFGLTGHANWAIIDALIEKPQVKQIMVKHEAQAVFMADAFFRLRHKIALVTASVGPGALNLVGALANAFMDSSAVLTIAGAGPSQYFDKGGLEEIYIHFPEDFVSVIKPVVKHAWLATRPDTLPDFVARAYKVATSGRPGPVLVHAPFDIQHHKINVEKISDPKKYEPDMRVRGNLQSTRKAAELLAKAKKPLIVAGGGAVISEAAKELRKLSETHSIPVVTSLPAKGILPEDHPLSLGPVGRAGWECAAKATREADVILAVGCRFTDAHTGYWIKGAIYNIPPTKLIQIDIDPNEIGRNYPVEVGIVGDARTVLLDLIDIMGTTKEVNRSPWLRSAKTWKEEWDNRIKQEITSNKKPINPARLINDVKETLPRDAPVIIDTGDIQTYFEAYGKVYEPYTFFNNSGMCLMGFAHAGILGAKLARPDKPAVAIGGDGCFLMVNYSIATAVEYDIPVVWVILNNYGLNIERKGMQRLYGRDALCQFQMDKTKQLYSPDYVKLAEAYRAKGERIENPSDIKHGIQRALKANEPYVLEVVVDRDYPTYFCPGITWGYPRSWA